jgi:hypothetical protein
VGGLFHHLSPDVPVKSLEIRLKFKNEIPMHMYFCILNKAYEHYCINTTVHIRDGAEFKNKLMAVMVYF